MSPTFYGTVQALVSDEFELEADTEDAAIEEAEKQMRLLIEGTGLDYTDLEVTDVQEEGE